MIKIFSDSMFYKMPLTIVLLGFIAACGVDKNHPKYDELRYEELKKANCHDMASVLSADFLMETPEDFDTAFKRCEDTKSLSFEEYKAFVEHGRASGSWDIYEMYPEKQKDDQQL